MVVARLVLMRSVSVASIIAKAGGSSFYRDDEVVVLRGSVFLGVGKDE